MATMIAVHVQDKEGETAKREISSEAGNFSLDTFSIGDNYFLSNNV
jgi:hypothetical protein